jgi:hypothetical protein
VNPRPLEDDEIVAWFEKPQSKSREILTTAVGQLQIGKLDELLYQSYEGDIQSRFASLEGYGGDINGRCASIRQEQSLVSEALQRYKNRPELQAAQAKVQGMSQQWPCPH